MPALNRRNLLTAAAALGAPAVAVAALPDPVLGAIDRWRGARSALLSGDHGSRSLDAYNASVEIMLTTPPTTLRGLAALFAVLAASEFPAGDWPTVENGMLVELMGSDVACAERFPAMVAAAVGRMATEGGR